MTETEKYKLGFTLSATWADAPQCKKVAQTLAQGFVIAGEYVTNSMRTGLLSYPLAAPRRSILVSERMNV